MVEVSCIFFPIHILIDSIYKDSGFHWPSLGHLQPLILGENKASNCTGLPKLPTVGKKKSSKENRMLLPSQGGTRTGWAKPNSHLRERKAMPFP